MLSNNRTDEKRPIEKSEQNIKRSIEKMHREEKPKTNENGKKSPVLILHNQCFTSTMATNTKVCLFVCLFMNFVLFSDDFTVMPLPLWRDVDGNNKFLFLSLYDKTSKFVASLCLYVHLLLRWFIVFFFINFCPLSLLLILITFYHQLNLQNTFF